MKKRTFDFILYGLTRIVIILIGWFANILIVNKCTVEAYGSFSLFVTIAGFCSAVIIGWTNAAFFYFGLNEKRDNNCLSNTFWSRNVIVGSLLLVGSSLIIIFRNQISIYVGLDVGIQIILWCIFYYFSDVLNVYYLIHGNNMLANLTTGIPKIMLLICVWKLNIGSVKLLIHVYIFTQISSLLVGVRLDKKELALSRTWRKCIGSFLKFSMYEFMGFIGIYLINYCDNIIINLFYTKEYVAKYNVAYTLFSALAGLSYIISNFFSKDVAEYLGKRNEKKLYFFFYRIRWWLLAVVGVLHIIAYSIVPIIIRLLYGNRYIDAIGVLRILLIASFFAYVNVFYVTYYNCKLENKRAQIVNIIQSIINVAADLVFIKYTGNIQGAAWGTVISYIVSAILLASVYEKRIYRDANSMT